LLFWFFTSVLDSGGRKSFLEAVRRGVVFVLVTVVVIVLIGTT